MRPRWAFVTSFTMLIIAAAALAWFRPDRAIQIASGAVAHNICSASFLSGRDPGAVVRDELLDEPGMALLGPFLSYGIDRRLGEAHVTIAGLFESRARFVPGRGCRLVLEPMQDPPPLPAMEVRSSTSVPMKLHSTEPGMIAALDRAFAEPAKTRAIVVMHNGRIVAERYAPGWSADMRIWGHSLTKSVTHALLGILLQRGSVDLDRPAPIPEWSNPDDPRHAITVRHLMTMTAGFPEDETGAGWDRSSRMWFVESDEGAFAASERPRSAPGTQWAYHNGSVMLLARIIRERVDGDAQLFAGQALFQPAGMTSAVLEIDGAGTPIGSTFMWATARDWARFGQLYLDNGVVDGKGLLPDGWAEQAATPTPFAAGGYGALFWTNRGDSPGARSRRAAGMPADSYAARGYRGQWIIIVPSARLVIARFGNDHGGATPIVARLAADVISALPTSAD